MALCCDTPMLTRIKRIKENRTVSEFADVLDNIQIDTSSENGLQVSSKHQSQVLKMQNGNTQMGSFPTLPREEMTNVVTPVADNNAMLGGSMPPGSIPPAPVPGTPIVEPVSDIFPDAPTFQVPPNPLLPPEYSETLDYGSLQYLNGFYRTQIGRYVRVEQQINSTDIEIRYGFLIGVGINYILLQDASTGNVYAIDSYSIKLFYVYYNFEGPFDPSLSGSRM